MGISQFEPQLHIQVQPPNHCTHHLVLNSRPGTCVPPTASTLKSVAMTSMRGNVACAQFLQESHQQDNKKNTSTKCEVNMGMFNYPQQVCSRENTNAATYSVCFRAEKNRVAVSSRRGVPWMLPCNLPAVPRNRSGLPHQRFVVCPYPNPQAQGAAQVLPMINWE